MPRTKPTKKDYENQFAPCLDCSDYGVLLDAGTESKYSTCDKCGSRDVILINQFMVNENCSDQKWIS